MQLLAKMCGWNEPEKHEFEHGYKAQQDLVEVIARLRGRGAARNDQSTGKAGTMPSFLDLHSVER